MFKRIINLLLLQYLIRKRSIKRIILFLKTKEKIVVKDFQGIKMFLDLRDGGISTDLALDGIREPESTRIIQQTLKTGDVVVDIGANIGYYALMEARLVGKEGVVYGIEPSPKNINLLKKNIKLNNFKNLKTYQIGIGDKKGTAKMYVSPHSNLNSLVRQKNRKIINTIDIEVRTLDDFLKDKKYPDLIRMDVEGYEYSIFKGMKKILSDERQLKLFIELHPHIMKRTQTIYVLRNLMQHGFETSKVIKSITVTEMKVMMKKDYDFSSMTIKDLMRDESIINGSKGAFEIFVERK